jgi:hypothetical protein
MKIIPIAPVDLESLLAGDQTAFIVFGGLVLGKGLILFLFWRVMGGG